MKHKLLTLLIAIMASLGTMFAQSGPCGDNLTWNLTNGVLTISGTGAMTDYTSSSKAPWFAYSNSINSVVIGDGVTSIGKWAFSNCNGMTSATIGNSVASIGDYAFFECSALTSTGIPNSVTTIGNSAFIRCTSLESVVIPGSVTRFGNYAFYQCNSLSSVVIIYGVTSIGTHAFDECSNLASVSLPNSITSIEEASFRNCSSLTSMTIPSNVISIGESAFQSCTSLTSVSIPNSVTSIGNSAFAGDWVLTSIELPNSLTSIGESAFGGCRVITSITNYATVPQVITASTFNNLNKYACTLYVPAESVEAYKAADVWKEFPHIQAIDSTEKFHYATLADVYNMAADSTFTLGAFDVVYVPDFQSGSNMYIKDSTGSCVIYKVNYGLQAGDHVEAGMQGKISIYNGLYEIIPITAKEELIITHGAAPAPMVATEVPSLDNASQYVVYEGVSFATDTAFVEGKRHAVYGSWNGQTITFYNQYYIGATLSAGRTYNITAVNTIYRTTPQAYPLAVEEVTSEPCLLASGTCGAQGDNLTWTLSCDSVLTISGTGAMANGAANQDWSSYRNQIKNVILPDGLTNIGTNAFAYCSNLQAVLIPETVDSIGPRAFYNCSNLQTINMPNSVHAFGHEALVGCNSLTEPVYNATIFCYMPRTYVGAYAIPEGIVSVAAYAFEGCVSETGSGFLSEITIPNSVKRLGNYSLGAYLLQKITSYAVVPPVCMTDVFVWFDEEIAVTLAVNKSIPVYVPAESVEAYKAADGWKEFENILPIGGYPEVNDTLTIAEAIQIGMALDSMATSVDTYTIEGYVINAGAFYKGSKDQSWYMADDAEATSSDFQAYRCYPIDGTDTVEVHNGSKVRMTGKLQKYYNRSTGKYIVEMTYTPAFILSTPVQAPLDTITVAQALEIGATLAENASTAKQYVIRGYVTSIVTPFDEQYGNQTFYIADDINSTADFYATGGFQVYRGKPVTGKAIAVGALVELTTAIKNYRGIIIESAETNVPVTVLEEGPECRILSGTCGENLTWTLNTCDSVLTISGTGAMYNYSKQNVAPWAYLGVKSAVIGNGVTTLGTFAFYQCAMSSISIPASVTKVHFNTFNNSYNLMNFTVDSANPVYSSLDGVLFNKDQTIIVRYPRGRQGEYAIPEGVVIVGDGAFNGCYNVTDVKIPNSVTTLGMAAFFACGMAEITIPENVNRIDSLAFIGCQHLKVVTNYAIEPQVIDTNVFGGVIDISECTLYVPAQSLAAYQTADVWKDFGNIVAMEGTPEPCVLASGTCGAEGDNLTWTLSCDSVLTISGTGAMADYEWNKAPWFSNAANIVSVEISDGITSIGDYAFNHCSKISSVSIPNGVTSIGFGAFNQCFGLTSVNMPNTLTTIGESAFVGDKSLTSITIPSSVTNIGNWAFENASKITSIICEAVNPPVLAAAAYSEPAVFLGIDKSIPLYVPAESIELYRTAAGWKEFTNILPIEGSTPSHEIDRTGTCGDNMALTWTYDPGTKTLTISGNGTLNSNYTFGPEAPTEMEQLIIAEGVTSIGDSAFRNMSTLQTMQLPASLKTIGAKAFENCINLTSIYNYRERPCLVDATAFDGVNKFDCTLYVLEGSVEMYKSAASDWKDFYFILPISTTTVTEPVSDVTVEPHDNAATVTWPTQDNAVTYAIEISKDGVVFCRLTFNANGLLTGIAFAPGRDGSHNAPAALMTVNGLQFTVTGLNSNTKYSYSVTAKDGNDVPVATYSGEFFTTGEGIATAVDNTTADSKATKLLLNGQILILRGEKEYTLTGQEIK